MLDNELIIVFLAVFSAIIGGMVILNTRKQSKKKR